MLEQDAWHPELRWCATPEEVCRRSRDHGHVGAKRAHLVRHILVAEREHVRVDEQGGMASLAQKMLCDAQLERQVRRAASEIDAAVVIPVRVNERDLHQAAPTTRRGWLLRVSSHSHSVRRPSVRAICGFQPVALRKARVSDTYQG